MSRAKMLLATLAAAGLLGAVAMLPALAQDSDEGPDTSESPAESWQGRVADRHAAFAEALADELGLPVEQVTQALGAVREQMAAEARTAHLERLDERLADAVEAGNLTQEQADAIRAAAEEGVFPLGRRGHGPRGHRGGPGFGRFAPDSAA